MIHLCQIVVVLRGSPHGVSAGERDVLIPLNTVRLAGDRGEGVRAARVRGLGVSAEGVADGVGVQCAGAAITGVAPYINSAES